MSEEWEGGVTTSKECRAKHLGVCRLLTGRFFLWIVFCCYLFQCYYLGDGIAIIVIAIALANLAHFVDLAVIIITDLLPRPATTFLHMNALKHLPSTSYIHNIQHMNVLKHFKYMQYGCGMQSVVVYSLNHDTTSSFGLHLNLIFQNLAPTCAGITV